MQISQKKNIKERSVLFIRLKKNLTFLFQYIYIYLYIYIEKRMQHSAVFCKRTKHSRVFFTFFAKKILFFAFFYVLCKRTCDLGVLLGFISCQNLKKRTEKNVAFFKRTERSEQKRMRCPTLHSNSWWSSLIMHFQQFFSL